jgi:uncharacterized protein (DUF849 family)/GNAT superfamily N-acetyltransferase
MAPVAASHEIPDPERSSVNVAHSFIALDAERVVGVGSYIMLSDTEAETASLAVDPDYVGLGIGYRLQRARLREMRERGVTKVRTEADRPQTIRWYINKFGYKVVGRNPKKHAFGLAGVDHWTVLELDLEYYSFLGKLIINAALTGVVPTKEQNPHIPLTPREIARDAKRVYELGASMVHIHVRDANGNHSHHKELYRETISRIRESCEDLIIVATTSGRRAKNVSERMGALELDAPYRPDMASLTLGSMNFPAEPSVNSPEDIGALLTQMQERGIRPELEIFEPGMANYSRFLVNRGLLTGRPYANIILGSLGTSSASPQNLMNIVEQLPEDTVWAATGVGRFSFGTQCLSMAMGGHVRVGLEDGLYMDGDKDELASNERLVARVRRVAEAMGREVARPKEVRRILGL